MMTRHQECKGEIDTRQGSFSAVRDFGKTLVSGGHFASSEIVSRLAHLEGSVEALLESWKDRQEMLVQCYDLQVRERMRGRGRRGRGWRSAERRRGRRGGREEGRQGGGEGGKRGGRVKQAAGLRGESNGSMIGQPSGTDRWMKWKRKRIELECGKI